MTEDYRNTAWCRDGINMIDCDPDWPLKILGGALDSPADMVAAADRYFDAMLTGTRVTDMAFAVFQQTSMVDSARMDWLFRKLNRLEETGALRAEGRWAYVMKTVPPLYRALETFGLDWAQIALDGCRRRGGRPWIYFRMNDLHAVDDPASIFHDPFFYEAREKGWLNGNPVYGHPLGTSGDVRDLYNFACPAVREWMLSYLEEIILRYDAFGFELDFMRNVYCFDYLNAEAGYEDLMTDFIRRVKGFVTRAEEKFGHGIKLAVRLGQSVEQNLIYGFDVAAWVKEDLVDLLIPSCEEVCNSGVDVPHWREVVGERVALAVGFDSHVIRWLVHEAAPLYAMREDHLRAFGACYFNRGADGLYFNNYDTPDKPARLMGRDTLEAGLRTLAVTHQDIAPLGCDRYKPLPLELAGGASLTLNPGRIRGGDTVAVTVGYDSEEAAEAAVYLDGLGAASREIIPIRPDRVEGHYYDEAWGFHAAAVLVRYGFEGFTAEGDLTVTLEGTAGRAVYLDVSVTP